MFPWGDIPNLYTAYIGKEDVQMIICKTNLNETVFMMIGIEKNTCDHIFHRYNLTKI